MSSKSERVTVQEVSDAYVTATHQGVLSSSETDALHQCGLQLYPYSFAW